MKVIFLDIDGVLNPLRPNTLWKMEDQLSKDCVYALNIIHDNVEDLKIVISSSWRIDVEFEKLKKMLYDVGVKTEIIGKTPEWKTKGDGIIVTAHEDRGEEIQDWLSQNKHLYIENIIILDDVDDFKPNIKGKVLLTKSEIGLTIADSEQAILMLKSLY